MKTFHGRVIVPGSCEAEALVSHGGLNTLASFQKALQFGDEKATCGDQNNPDLYGRELAGNRPMRRAVQEAVLSGMPTVAECGGYLYLCEKLEDSEGLLWPMAAALPGTGRNQKRLVRFGYAHLTAAEDSLLFQKGERAPIHEFHYWDTEPGGGAFSMEKPVTGRQWQGGFASPSLYAAFGHLYFDETRAGRLAAAMTHWKEEKGNGRA